MPIPSEDGADMVSEWTLRLEASASELENTENEQTSASVLFDFVWPLLGCIRMKLKFMEVVRFLSSSLLHWCAY